MTFFHFCAPCHHQQIVDKLKDEGERLKRKFVMYTSTVCRVCARCDLNRRSTLPSAAPAVCEVSFAVNLCLFLLLVAIRSPL